MSSAPRSPEPGSSLAPAAVAELAAEVARHPHGRVPAEVRRRHVVAVAAELFAERGYRDTSMDDVAARAGVSKPVVYGLVGDKPQLFSACTRLATDELSERVRRAVRAEVRPVDRFRAGARAFFAFVGETGPLWDHLVSGEGGPVGADAEAARRRQAAMVAGLLAEGAGAGSGDPVGDPATAAPVDAARVEALACATNGALEALARWWRDHPDRDADDLADLATSFLTPGLVLLVPGT
jgi:AcrR family transcriptional regulator